MRGKVREQSVARTGLGPSQAKWLLVRIQVCLNASSMVQHNRDLNKVTVSCLSLITRAVQWLHSSRSTRHPDSYMVSMPSLEQSPPPNHPRWLVHTACCQRRKRGEGAHTLLKCLKVAHTPCPSIPSASTQSHGYPYLGLGRGTRK